MDNMGKINFIYLVIVVVNKVQTVYAALLPTKIPAQVAHHANRFAINERSG